MIKVFIVLRVVLGSVFLVSGGEKLIGPYQNFLYVVQNYEVFTPAVEEIIARTFPWIELILGVFLILGLWIKWTLRGIIIMLTGFVCIVSQALLRQLPIVECGCFGDLISFPLHVVLIFDSVLFMIAAVLLIKIQYTVNFSLDKYYSSD